jgi:carboxymethylenebutenolidase
MTSPTVPQAMIDAYYEYTHLTQDRRAFVSKLRALAQPEREARISDPFKMASSVRTNAEAKRPQ